MLDALRAESYRLGQFDEAYTELINVWTLFGFAMGLDESQERERRRADSAAHGYE